MDGLRIDRRTLLQAGTAAAAGLALSSRVARAAEAEKVVRVSVLGTGGRGRGLLGILLGMKGVEVPALCDTHAPNLAAAIEAVEKSGRKRPEGYGDGPEAYRKLLARDDVDAVIIASPWELHTPMAVAAMKAGKYAGVEVPCAYTLDECWQLVRTHEETGVPCMMLENWSFRKDNLAVLNMIRKGLLGEMVHCHCAHSHDCIDHWFWDREGNERWAAKYLIHHNRDQYPTHSLGPVLSWMNINCGDNYATLIATATASRGINAHFARKFGPEDPRATRKYAQGDIVTSVIRTQGGKSIVVNYDMQLPRPYDNRWMVQGTLGIYREEPSQAYILGRSPKYHEWEPFAPYQTEFDHAWWKSLAGDADAARLGHGGTDFIELREFVRAVRNRSQTPIDVYDSVAMSVIGPLSEESIAKGGAPVACPDFTGGKWKTRKPAFAMEI